MFFFNQNGPQFYLYFRTINRNFHKKGPKLRSQFDFWSDFSESSGYKFLKYPLKIPWVSRHFATNHLKKNRLIPLLTCCILWMLPVCHHTHITYKLYHKKGCNFAALVVGCLANCIINYSAKHWDHLCPASDTVSMSLMGS